MTADGMPTNSIFDIAQHPSGMMWFITKSGPAYYDTKTWHTFPDSLGLPSLSNSKIIILDSTVWVTGLNKMAFTLQYYDGKWNSIKIPFKSDLVNYHIGFDIIKSEGKYYVAIGSRNLLFIYDLTNDHWEMKDIGSMNINSIHSIDGSWIITSTNGVWEYQSGEMSKLPLPYEKFPTQNILTLARNEDRLHLLGYDWYAELIDYELDILIEDMGLNSSSTSTQSSLVITQNGMTLFGSNTPARLVDQKNGTWQNLLINGENVNIGSSRIFCDIENNIWVSDSRGLFKFNVDQFMNYNRSSGLTSDEVTVVYELQNGTMILANPYSLNTINESGIVNYGLEIDPDLTYRILDIEEYPEKRQILVATNDGGLLIYDANNFSQPVKTINSDRFKITSIERYKNQLYVAGNEGFYRYEKNKLNLLVPLGGVRNMSNLGDKLALLTNSKGLFLYDEDTISHHTSPNFDLNSVYKAVVFNNELVLATKNGLGTLSAEGKIIEWDEIDIKSPVYGLIIDSKDRLWIGSDHGVYMYNGSTVELFDLDEGLIGSEINRNALFEDSDGKIWIGTEKGASIYRDNSDLNRYLNLNVDITKVTAKQNKSLETFKNNTIPYDANGLEIRFQCLSYIDEEKISFRYRVDQASNNSKWIVTDNSNNNIIFSNIQSGNYQFEIQARFGTGEWGPISSFKFTIEKPFYMQWWFIAIGIILLIIVARTIFYFRYILLIRKQKKLKEIVAARTKEIRLLNEKLEEKVMLRTQELHDKNLRLEDYAYVNAHHLRAPLTKIMSVLHVVDAQEDKTVDQKLINILKESVAEIDEVIHSINEILKK